MPEFNAKTIQNPSDSKRHFTVINGNKEHGLYISSTPFSAAKKAVTKLSASSNGEKVEFSIREITQGSKKKLMVHMLDMLRNIQNQFNLKVEQLKIIKLFI